MVERKAIESLLTTKHVSSMGDSAVVPSSSTLLCNARDVWLVRFAFRVPISDPCLLVVFQSYMATG